MITLIIKGSIFDACKALQQRNVAPVSLSQRVGLWEPEVIASVSDRELDAVRMWYCEEPGAAPFPAGVLLFYTQRQERERTADALFASEARELRAKFDAYD